VTRRGRLVALVAAATLAAPLAARAQDAAKGADLELIRVVRALGDRIAAIVGRPARGDLMALRAEEPARIAAARSRAARMLPDAVAAARGRAWSDLGWRSTDPAELVAALELDLAGMTLDADGGRLLVDPTRLVPDSGHGDPNEDPDASLLLATGVAADEPVAGHYIAHILTDEPPPASPPTTDSLLARAALSEGTANLAALILLFGGVGLEAEVVGGTLRPEDALAGRLVGPGRHAESPAVASLVEFAYLDGFAQAAAIAKRGDFRRLLAERKTRRTTRDVIHLDRPPATPPEVSQPVIPGPAEWSLADRDALGEQGIVVLVSHLTGKDNLGLMAGDGWVADALWRFEPKGADPSRPGFTVWTTRWTSEDEAKDFLYALERCFQARFPSEAFHDLGDGARSLGRADRSYRIEIRGSEVSLRIAPPSIEALLQKKKGAEPRSRPPK